jgi:DNA-binding transcriptional regulator YiaG
MSKKICPVCGADTLKMKNETQILKESYGGQKEVNIVSYHCTTCESEGDFFDENEEIVNKNLELLKEQTVKNIISDFANNKISMSAIERALSLPQRTITKWRNGVSKPSAAGLALLKYLRTFPWLIEIAENNFDYSIAQKIHINSAVQKFLKYIDHVKINLSLYAMESCKSKSTGFLAKCFDKSEYDNYNNLRRP